MKKRVITFILLLVFSGVAIPSFGAGEEAAPSPCPAIGFARELGLLVLGIGWESVRIVLPDSCPLKEKDIDRLMEQSRSEN